MFQSSLASRAHTNRTSHAASKSFSRPPPPGFAPPPKIRAANAPCQTPKPNSAKPDSLPNQSSRAHHAGPATTRQLRMYFQISPSTRGTALDSSTPAAPSQSPAAAPWSRISRRSCPSSAEIHLNKSPASSLPTDESLPQKLRRRSKPDANANAALYVHYRVPIAATTLPYESRRTPPPPLCISR